MLVTAVLGRRRRFLSRISNANWDRIRPPRKVNSEALTLRLSRQPGCVLHLPRRRRLGDRQPHRSVDPDGAVSVSDRAYLARRLLRLEGARRPGGGAVAADLAAAGRR